MNEVTLLLAAFDGKKCKTFLLLGQQSGNEYGRNVNEYLHFGVVFSLFVLILKLGFEKNDLVPLLLESEDSPIRIGNT